MKLLCTALSSLLLACGAQAIQPVQGSAPEGQASLDDCTRVYQHILETTVVQEVDVDLTLTPDQHQAAVILTDQEWTDEGRTARFYHACAQMTQEQVSCALGVAQVADISACVKAWPRPPRR